MKPCLCLIDGSGYIFRAFFAIPPMTRPDGVPVNAVYGYSNMLMRLMDEHRCDFMVVVFDSKRKTFRNEFYPQYKANRPPVPDALAPQFALIREATKAFGVDFIDKENYEADDIIASYTQKALNQGMQVKIISGDKDLMQLVEEDVELFDPIKNKTIGIKEVGEKFGVPPRKVIDVQALMGDATDNIPGAKGIGPKGAMNLMNQFDSIADLYANLNKVENSKIKGILENNKENVLISLKLATLEKNVPDLPEIETFFAKPIDNEKLLSFLKENNFKRMISALNLESTKKMPGPKIQIPQNITEIANFLQQNTLSFYFKAEGEKVFLYIGGQDKVLCVPIFLEESLFIPIGAFSLSGIQKILIPVFKDENVLKICFDFLSFDSIFQIPGKNLVDLGIMFYDLYGVQKEIIPENLLSDFMWDAFLAYDNTNDKDAFFTYYMFYIFHSLYEKLEQDEEAFKIYEKLDMPCLPVVANMQSKGICIDTLYLKSLLAQIQEKTKQVHDKILKQVGYAINLNSPKQLAHLFFEEMKLNASYKTENNQFSTDSSVLEKMQKEGVKIAGDLLKYRELSKLLNTYLLPIQKRLTKDGKIKSNFSLVSTSTGRLVSFNPNLQNIPIRGEYGKELRNLFIAQQGKILIDADYSQIELRIMAIMANSKNLLQAFKENKDIHKETAAKIFKVPLNEVTSSMRNKAKSINFGIIYGMSAYGLAENLGIEKKEAETFIQNYFQEYPEIKTFMDKQIEKAKTFGYVETYMHRKCYIGAFDNAKIAPALSRAAINAPIQGTAADFLKKAMVELNWKLAPISSHLLLQIHDELLFEVNQNDADKAIKIIQDTMENVMELPIPLKVEINTGYSWGKAHE